jgi:hypothetical protein
MLPLRSRLVVVALAAAAFAAAASTPAGARPIAPTPSAHPHGICKSCTGRRPMTPLLRHARRLCRQELAGHRR